MMLAIYPVPHTTVTGLYQLFDLNPIYPQEAIMDPTDLGAGTATWATGTVSIILGGFLWLRRLLSKDAADRAMDNAGISAVQRLNELLDSERAARATAEARADQYAKERNELAAVVGRMEGKVEVLTGQVAQLTEKVTTQSTEMSRLRSQRRSVI
jgi:hypothetical protein